MSQRFTDFMKLSDVKYIRDFDVSSISSIRVGGKTKYLVKPDNEDKLISVLDFLVEENLKYIVVGGMTNILPRDEYYDGAIISTANLRNYFRAENVITVGTGIKLSELIMKASRLGLGGAESLFGIPGSIGGAVSGNAGAYGNSVSDFLIRARIYDPKKRKILVLENQEMNFSYRNSCIKSSSLVILSASFAFIQRAKADIDADFQKYTALRKNTQPYGERSLGSIFKRCGDVPTSLLIDKIGLKGYRIGGAEVSEKHAGFIVNRGGAKAKDIRALILTIKKRILLEYGLLPEEEIQYM